MKTQTNSSTSHPAVKRVRAGGPLARVIDLPRGDRLFGIAHCCALGRLGANLQTSS